MQRNSRIKLLITLVLGTLVTASAGYLSSADARGLSGPGASTAFGMTQPEATPASGDPDVGQGRLPPPPTVKHLDPMPGGWIGRGPGFVLWVQWTSWIWATLYLRAGR